MGRLRASGGSDVQLDRALAAQAARAYATQSLAAAPKTWDALPRVQVEVGARRVHVLVSATLQTAFLRIVAISSVPVDATAYADVQFGIHDGSGS